MANKTRVRERDPEAEASDTRLYEPKQYEYVVEELDRAAHGRIVVHAVDRPWDGHRQGIAKRYLSPHEPELRDTATHQWEVSLQRASKRSGEHRHQGGPVMFVLEGVGHSVIDGVRHDWEAGDLVMLPLAAGGIEHQHFNHDPEHPAKWIAVAYRPFAKNAGSEITELEPSPAGITSGR